MSETETVKVVLLGDTGVGKSSLLTRFAKDIYEEDISSTMSAAFMSRTVKVGDRNINFNVWDTAGQERFRALSQLYYRDALVVILIFSVTDADSYNNLKHWHKEVVENADPDIGQTYVSHRPRGQQRRPSLEFLPV